MAVAVAAPAAAAAANQRAMGTMLPAARTACLSWTPQVCCGRPGDWAALMQITVAAGAHLCAVAGAWGKEGTSGICCQQGQRDLVPALWHACCNVQACMIRCTGPADTEREALSE